MAVVATVAAISLALVFILAVWAHRQEPNRIAAAAEQLGAGRFVGWLAGGFEAGLVLTLLMSPKLGGLVAATYLAILMTAFLVASLSGRTVEDCGCGREQHAMNASWYLRNILLMGLGVVAFLYGPTGFAYLAAFAGGAVGFPTAFYLSQRANAHPARTDAT